LDLGAAERAADKHTRHDRSGNNGSSTSAGTGVRRVLARDFAGAFTGLGIEGSQKFVDLTRAHAQVTFAKIAHGVTGSPRPSQLELAAQATRNMAANAAAALKVVFGQARQIRAHVAALNWFQAERCSRSRSSLVAATPTFAGLLRLGIRR
jgi:hypothetical protein